MASKTTKRKPGPPRRYGYRPTLTVRLQSPIYDAIKASAAEHGKSLSEEIEDRLEVSREVEGIRAEARQMLREASAIRSAARVQAYRDAGFQILRETDGSPRRLIIDADLLEGEVNQRHGFIADAPPAGDPQKPPSAEEVEIARRKIGEIFKTGAADDDDAAA